MENTEDTVMENTKPEESTDKNDGMHLIVEISYSLTALKEYISKSCLAEKCEFLQHTKDIEEICREFIKILKSSELNLDEISTLFVAASMIYFIDATPENFEWRSHFLQKTFQYVDTLKPQHIHIATKRIWSALETGDIQFFCNILTLCHQLSVASETGRAIAICLIWKLLCILTETKNEMCCFLEFNELYKMLSELDEEMLQKEENIHSFYILVHSLGFLINSVVNGKNEAFIKAGYRNYFSYTQRDLEKLKKYAERMSSLLKISIFGDNYFELKMTISEYLNVNIISILQERLYEMQNI